MSLAKDTPEARPIQPRSATPIEAVGIPATFDLCEQVVAAGGTIANIGVHGKKVDLHRETLWDHNISITTRLVDAATTPLLLKIVQSKKIDLKSIDYTSFLIG